MESTDTQSETSSSPSLTNALLTCQTSEQPLVGLLTKSPTEMTDEELSEFVQRTQRMRANHAAFRANVVERKTATTSAKTDLINDYLT